jgi:hypothetical protein
LTNAGFVMGRLRRGGDAVAYYLNVQPLRRGVRKIGIPGAGFASARHSEIS